MAQEFGDTNSLQAAVAPQSADDIASALTHAIVLKEAATRMGIDNIQANLKDKNITLTFANAADASKFAIMLKNAGDKTGHALRAKAEGDIVPLDITQLSELPDNVAAAIGSNFTNAPVAAAKGVKISADSSTAIPTKDKPAAACEGLPTKPLHRGALKGIAMTGQETETLKTALQDLGNTCDVEKAQGILMEHGDKIGSKNPDGLAGRYTIASLRKEVYHSAETGHGAPKHREQKRKHRKHGFEPPNSSH